MTNWVICMVVRYFFHCNVKDNFEISWCFNRKSSGAHAYPDLGSSGSGVVVVVHDDVHEEVQNNDDPLLKRHRGQAGKSSDFSGLLTTEVFPSSWL